MSSKFVANKKSTKEFDDDGEENTLNQMINLSKSVDEDPLHSASYSKEKSSKLKYLKVKPLKDKNAYDLLNEIKRYETFNSEVYSEISEINENVVKVLQNLETKNEYVIYLNNELNTTKEDYKILKELNDANIRELDDKDTELSMIRKNHDEITLELVDVRMKNDKLQKDYKVLGMYFFYMSAFSFMMIAYQASSFF